MRHYVFLKFHAGYSADGLLDEIERILEQARDTISGFESYQMLKEFGPNVAPLSALIVLKFRSLNEKDDFLKHPLHFALLQHIKPVTTEKAVFDDTNLHI